MKAIRKSERQTRAMSGFRKPESHPATRHVVVIEIITPAFFHTAMNSLLLEEKTSTGIDVS